MDDIDKCAKTKSVLGVLGPIANQVVELKGRQCVVCDATTVMKLMKQCQALEASCALLVSRLESYAVRHRDDVLSSEVKKIKSQMDQVAVSLTDATRDLHRGDVGVRDNEEVWAEIVESTEHLLSTLTEVLMAWDRAQFRRVTESLEHLQQCLNHLEQTHSIQHLPDKFQAVVSASVDLLRLLEVRCGDLYRQAQQETVRVLALQYCHTLPLLASTCAATVTQPLSKHIRASRELVSSHLQMLLTDLHSHVGHGVLEYDMDEAGSFITCVDKVLELLLESQDTSGSVSKYVGSFSERVKPLLEKVLRHGIAVAYFSSPDDNHIIMAMCENVLKQLKILVSLERNETPDAVDVEISCDVLGDSVELLEQKVNTALIRLIVQTFSAPIAPLQNLMEVLSPEANTVDQKTLDTRIKDFDLHVDHIFQVGGFATACTTDIERVRLIQDSLLTLEWMEGCLVPSVVSAYKDPHPNACAHAHMLAGHWVVAVKQLWDCLDHIMDPSAFSMVSKHEVHCAWAQLKEHLYTQDVPWIRKQVTRVATLTSRILSLHGKNTFLTDPQVDDLQVAIKEVMKSAEAVFASPTDLSRHRSMIKRVQLILTLLARLSNSLNENNLLSNEDLPYIEVHDKKGEDKQLKTELTNTDKQLLTSNIDDICIDIATPVSLNLQKESAISQQPTIKGTYRNQQQKKSLKPSSKSTSRLGEVRTRAANFDMSGHHSRSVQALANETLACETSIDITKFLSRSTNIMSSSVRASRRNYTLRVKEINLDMDRALLTKTIHPSHPSRDLKDDSPEVQTKTTYSDMNDTGISYSESSSVVARETFSSHTEELSKNTELTCVSGQRLKEISNLIAQRESLNFPSQQSIDAELSDLAYKWLHHEQVSFDKAVSSMDGERQS
ncbi:uncharacterized protein [Panulirus ornatus]|uniref:uncharacterized protein isoform X2 n=1 Tax=Panulirus ornatus TaxID=150431 RepID=UPI003A871721